MNMHGFILERDEPIEELRAQAHIYRHAKTGAQLLSVVNDDENKVFGIAFRTPPEDSTGVPHILEHAVLNGSQKYPLKEPFLELVKGSLKTFLNAMTYPDRTVYPVASTNQKDFYNLVDVYLDAVFFPLLLPHHLQQEGWHYALEEAGAPLAFKGVVFNEMKGAYSSPESLLSRYGQQTLYPDTPYRHDSGGDPQAIPELTYAQFKRFHDTYYHPSNALIFFYGDDPEPERLRLLAGYLERFEARPVEADIPLQTPLAAPRRYTYPYGVDGSAAAEEAAGNGAGNGASPQRRTLLSVNWLLPEKQEMNLMMALSVMSYALIGTQASPLRKALVDSGLGEDVLGGLGGSLRQMSFSAGMKNVHSADVDAVEALIQSTIGRVAAEGFDPELVEAALNSIEFGLRENNTGGSPRGLSLYLRALGIWLYGGDPLAPLRFEGPLAFIKRTLADDPTYLQTLIRTWLVDNPHRVTLVLEPDPTYNATLAAAEQERLQAARAAMDEAQLRAVLDTTQTLRRLQTQPDPPELLATLPSLTLADLDRNQRTIPTAVEEVGGVPVLTHDLFTNGILYLTLAWEMQRVPQELLPYVDLFGQALTQMGTQAEDYVKLSQRIGRTTGGVGASSFVSSVRGRAEPAAWFTLGGKATLARASDLLDILRDVLAGVKLDNPERLKQIVLRNKARMEGGLIPGGHGYVESRLRAAFTTANWVGEQMDGVENLFFQRRLVQEIESDFGAVLQRLEAVRARLIGRRSIVANVTLDAAGWQEVRPLLARFLESLPAGSAFQSPWQPGQLPAHEGLTLPAQVNYVGKAADLYAAGYRHHGSVNVIANLLRTGYLWDRVRARGGAYGAFTAFSRHSGVFSLTSYRDPNLLGTLDVYDGAAEYLRTLELSKTELTRAIIGAISSYDPYLLPDAKGGVALRRHLLGDTEEEIQRIREQILGTTIEHVHAFADVLHAALPAGRVVVLGSTEAIAAANAARDGWLTVQRVL